MTDATSAVALRSINAAQALLDRGKAEEALREADAAVKASPGSARARVMLGTVQAALGRDAEAGEAFARAMRLAPGDGGVLNAHAAWLCRNGRVDEALKAFSDATLDPDYRMPEQALANAGSCAAEAGRMAMAELNFRAALGLAPTDAQSLAGMARLEQARGDLLNARAFLQRREAVGPLGPGELALAIQIETQAGDRRAAERYRERLAALAASATSEASPSTTGSSRQ